MQKKLSNNPFYSREGFDCIYRGLIHGMSKNEIKSILQCLAIDLDLPLPKKAFFVNKSSHKKIKGYRKQDQIQGISEIVLGLNSPSSIMELCCGKAMLLKSLKEKFYPKEVYGVDCKKHLIDALERNSDKSEVYIHANIYDTPKLPNVDLITGLHLCGRLTNIAISYAISSRADIVVVPCCFSKIRSEQEDPCPQSLSLKSRKAEFQQILKRIKSLEGKVSDGKHDFSRLHLDLFRNLVNIDRLLKLKENGYETGIFAITPAKRDCEEGYVNSSLRYAIIGEYKNI